MKLASHNSLSYYPPQWWVIPFNWMARCQSLTIEQQYERGVRLFDIRLKWSKKHQDWISGHGIATYNVNIWQILSYLDFKQGCTVRIILEKGNELEFIRDVKEFINVFPDIEFICGRKKKGWVKLLPELPETDMNHLYWTHERWWKIPFPYLYAKKHNKENQGYLNETVWSMFDFIE